MIDNTQTTSILDVEDFLKTDSGRCGNPALGISMVPLSCGRDLAHSYSSNSSSIARQLEEIEDFIPDHEGGLCVSAYIVNGGLYLGIGAARAIHDEFTSSFPGDTKKLPRSLLRTFFPLLSYGGISTYDSVAHCLAFLEEEKCVEFVTRMIKKSILIPVIPDHKSNKTNDVLDYADHYSISSSLGPSRGPRHHYGEGAVFRYKGFDGEEKNFSSSSRKRLAGYPVSPGVIANSLSGLFLSDMNVPGKIGTIVKSGRILPARNVVVGERGIGVNVYPDRKVFTVTNPLYLTGLLYANSNTCRRISVAEYAGSAVGYICYCFSASRVAPKSRFAGTR